MKTEKAEKIDINFIKIILWFVGAAFLFFFGYLPASIIFLFSFLRFYVHYNRKTSLAVTGVTSAIVWGLFYDLLNIPPVELFF